MCIRDRYCPVVPHLMYPQFLKDSDPDERILGITLGVEPVSYTHLNRYDVTVLVNGFPLVHIELKRRGVAIREAFNQIERYQRESFWSGSGLYEYIQIFVISNGANTKYYSNSTRSVSYTHLVVF